MAVTTAIANLYFSMTLSIERYFVICRPFSKIKLNFKKCVLIVIPIITVISITWSISPLTGVSMVVYDEARISCSFTGTGPNVLVYTIFTAAVAYVFPFILMIFTSVSSIQMIRKSAKTFKNDKNSLKNIKKEAQLVKVAFVMISKFYQTPFEKKLKQHSCVFSHLSCHNYSICGLVIT
jgi:7 transmembrane receptor (rhodopsin family)